MEKIVRCPYCVRDNHFREMIGDGTGRFICAGCGHQVRHTEPEYRCFCEKCLLLNLPDP